MLALIEQAGVVGAGGVDGGSGIGGRSLRGGNIGGSAAAETADKFGYLPLHYACEGEVTPRADAAVVTFLLEVAPDTLDSVEVMREKLMYPDCLDVKTAQMILFACLLTNLAPAAKIHAIAAKRAGATREELHAVAGLAFLFRGLSAFNNGAQIINEVFSGDESIG